MGKLVFTAISSIAILLNSCTTNKVAQENQNSDYTVLMCGEYGGKGEDAIVVYTNPDEFNSYWRELQGDPNAELPQIDFKKEMVIAKHFLSRRTGGNEMAVHGVEYNKNQITVYYSSVNPSDMVAMVITDPLIMVKVKKVENPQIIFTHKK